MNLTHFHLSILSSNGFNQVLFSTAAVSLVKHLRHYNNVVTMFHITPGVNFTNIPRAAFLNESVFSYSLAFKNFERLLAKKLFIKCE